MNARFSRGVVCVVVSVVACPVFAQPPAPEAHVSVDPARRFQIIDGFGVNFNGTYFREAQKAAIDGESRRAPTVRR